MTPYSILFDLCLNILCVCLKSYHQIFFSHKNIRLKNHEFASVSGTVFSVAWRGINNTEHRYLNIFLSILNVPMATAFKPVIVEKSLFCMLKSGHFKLYSKYIDYFNLFFKPHSSIFFTWPPSRMNFIAFIRYNFIYIFQNIFFFKDANFFHRLLYLLKELSSTFLFDKCIT